MKNRFPTLVVLIAALFAPVSAHAQGINSPYKFLDHSQFVNVFGGYVNLAKGEIDAGPHSAPTFGARWALRVSTPLALGVEMGFTPTVRTVRDTVFGADSTYRSLGEADVKLLTGMATFRLNLMGPRTWNDLTPYLVLGGGVAVDLAPTAAAEAEMGAGERFDLGTSFAAQAGAGAEWYPSQRISLGVDVRNMVWKLKTPDAFMFSSRGVELTGKRWEQNFLVSAGLSIHF